MKKIVLVIFGLIFTVGFANAEMVKHFGKVIEVKDLVCRGNVCWGHNNDVIIAFGSSSILEDGKIDSTVVVTEKSEVDPAQAGTEAESTYAAEVSEVESSIDPLIMHQISNRPEGNRKIDKKQLLADYKEAQVGIDEISNDAISLTKQAEISYFSQYWYELSASAAILYDHLSSQKPELSEIYSFYALLNAIESGQEITELVEEKTLDSGLHTTLDYFDSLLARFYDKPQDKDLINGLNKITSNLVFLHDYASSDQLKFEIVSKIGKWSHSL